MTSKSFQIVQQAVKRSKSHTNAYVVIDKPKLTKQEQQHLEEILKNL